MNIYNLLGAITLTIGTCILIGVTITFAKNGNEVETIVGVTFSFIAGIGAIAAWIKSAL